jgi:trimethylamine--corrinoid protein Co-methyltransferase
VGVFHAEALELLKETEAVLIDDNRVHFQPSLVEAALASAPPGIPLCFRGSNRVSASLEGRIVSFGTGSDCLNIQDPRTGEKRPFISSDLEDCAHVVDALPELQFCMSMGNLSDLGTDNCYRDQFALMLKNTSKPIVFVCDDRVDCEAIVAMGGQALPGDGSRLADPRSSRSEFSALPGRIRRQ